MRGVVRVGGCDVSSTGGDNQQEYICQNWLRLKCNAHRPQPEHRRPSARHCTPTRRGTHTQGRLASSDEQKVLSPTNL